MDEFRLAGRDEVNEVRDGLEQRETRSSQQGLVNQAL
jgi:hypothetical protein